MLLNKHDKSFISRSDKPNENWLNDENYFVVPDGSETYNKILNYADKGGFNMVISEDNQLIDIVPIIPEVNIDEAILDLDYRLSCLELGV